MRLSRQLRVRIFSCRYIPPLRCFFFTYISCATNFLHYRREAPYLSKEAPTRKRLEYALNGLMCASCYSTLTTGLLYRPDISWYSSCIYATNFESLFNLSETLRKLFLVGKLKRVVAIFCIPYRYKEWFYRDFKLTGIRTSRWHVAYHEKV